MNCRFRARGQKKGFNLSANVFAIFVFYYCSSKMTKPQIVYFYDVMCGWCYGFGPVVKQLKDEFADRYDFFIVNAGMVTGGAVKPVAELADYLEEGARQVSKMTGARFGENYEIMLRVGTCLYSSEMPGKAHVLFKNLHLEGAFEFAHDLQKALFLDGKDLNKPETYGPLVAPHGLDAADFTEKLQQPEAEALAREEFEMVSKSGVAGYPTLLVGHKGHYQPIARGYQRHDILQSMLKGFKFEE